MRNWSMIYTYTGVVFCLYRLVVKWGGVFLLSILGWPSILGHI